MNWIKKNKTLTVLIFGIITFGTFSGYNLLQNQEIKASISKKEEKLKKIEQKETKQETKPKVKKYQLTEANVDEIKQQAQKVFAIIQSVEYTDDAKKELENYFNIYALDKLLSNQSHNVAGIRGIKQKNVNKISDVKDWYYTTEGNGVVIPLEITTKPYKVNLVLQYDFGIKKFNDYKYNVINADIFDIQSEKFK